ncbi:MAG: O-antigen ligase family protein [Solirubrobacteraceae bacterium]
MPRNPLPNWNDHHSAWLASVVAAGLTIYLGFEAGGFFPDATAVAVLVLGALLLLRILIAPDPFAGLGLRSLPTLATLGLFAAWTLASAWWSHAPSRAIIEFDHVLLYLLALLLALSLGSRRALLSGLIRGVSAGGVIICIAGLVTRTLPTTFPIALNVDSDRLSYPLTYWNALGLLAAVCLILCVGLSSSRREPRLVRVISATALPLLAVTLFFTFSRGAIAAGIVGLIAMLGLGRSRILLGVLAAIGPTVVAVIVAYRAGALAKADPTGPTAVSQGHHVALVVGACCAIALLLRVLLLRWDGRPARPRVSRKSLPRGVVRGTALTVVVVLVGIAVAGGAPAEIAHQYHRFVAGSSISSSADERTRLLDPGNNGRIEHWRVAVKAWRTAPARGQGAGTYQLLWEHYRRDDFQVVNAHSLYLEVLAELGVVGFALLAVALLSLLVALARLAARSDRPLAGAAFGATLAWMIEAGVDWVWQMPAVTVWVFAFGGMALANRRGERSLPTLGSTTRVLIALGVVIAVIMPARVGLSQLRLDQSVAAFRRGDCTKAIGFALGSNSSLGARPEPFEILGYCDARAGQTALAEHVIGLAVERDPANWEFHYDLALVRGAGGQDPRSEAARALALDPLQSQARALVKATQSSDPRRWRSASRVAPLLIPG